MGKKHQFFRASRRPIKSQRSDGDYVEVRIPALTGLRRRSCTFAAIELFCEHIGVSKSGSRIDYEALEGALRDSLDPIAHRPWPIAPRAMAVLDPVKLVIINWGEVIGGLAKDGSLIDDCTAPCTCSILK